MKAVFFWGIYFHPILDSRKTTRTHCHLQAGRFYTNPFSVDFISGHTLPLLMPHFLVCGQTQGHKAACFLWNRAAHLMFTMNFPSWCYSCSLGHMYNHILFCCCMWGKRTVPASEKGTNTLLSREATASSPVAPGVFPCTPHSDLLVSGAILG